MGGYDFDQQLISNEQALWPWVLVPRTCVSVWETVVTKNNSGLAASIMTPFYMR